MLNGQEGVTVRIPDVGVLRTPADDLKGRRSGARDLISIHFTRRGRFSRHSSRRRRGCLDGTTTVGDSSERSGGKAYSHHTDLSAFSKPPHLRLYY